jgi:hypothetical protein
MTKFSWRLTDRKLFLSVVPDGMRLTNEKTIADSRTVSNNKLWSSQ